MCGPRPRPQHVDLATVLISQIRNIRFKVNFSRLSRFLPLTGTLQRGARSNNARASLGGFSQGNYAFV